MYRVPAFLDLVPVERTGRSPLATGIWSMRSKDRGAAGYPPKSDYSSLRPLSDQRLAWIACPARRLPVPMPCQIRGPKPRLFRPDWLGPRPLFLSRPGRPSQLSARCSLPVHLDLARPNLARDVSRAPACMLDRQPAIGYQTAQLLCPLCLGRSRAKTGLSRYEREGSKGRADRQEAVDGGLDWAPVGVEAESAHHHKGGSLLALQ